MKLSDIIEQFIRDMFFEDEVELQRNELASYFRCSPSQINYVLTTRFSPESGYLINSNRGGGGSIRIKRLHSQSCDYMQYLMQNYLSEPMSQRDVKVLCAELEDRELVSKSDSELIISATSNQALSVPIATAMKNSLRTEILRNMLLTILARREKENENEM
ncbi:MAG: CtsR family transcriptional regulator [Christensenellales bacterium]|jgi:transcriptional regulator CtsR|nr:CtsR family transcriptional regulator [Clostridiales bacterium]